MPNDTYIELDQLVVVEKVPVCPTSIPQGPHGSETCMTAAALTSCIKRYRHVSEGTAHIIERRKRNGRLTETAWKRY